MELNEIDSRDYVQFEMTKNTDARPGSKQYLLHLEYVNGQRNSILV